MAQIEAIIGKDGKVEIKVDGVQGSSCESYTEQLKAALGGDVEEEEATDEYYEEAEEQLQW